VEIVDREDRSGKSLVQVAVSESGAEAALIRGLLENENIRTLVRPPIDGRVPPRGACRIWVRPDDAVAARKVLGEAIIEDPREDEIPEPVNAAHLSGRKPPGDAGFLVYAGPWVIAAAILALVFGVFLLVH
jgi:Putative prokaryotic signal transducing protein